VFRSCFGGSGTSNVQLVEREPHDWVSKPEHRGGVRLARGDHMSAGETLRIPSWMGRFEWGGLPLADVSRGLPTSAPWLFGVAIVSFDNNNTPPHVIRNIMQTLRGNLQRVLQAEVETGRVLTWGADDWGRLQQALTGGLETFRNAFQLTVGSTFNPDKPTGIQLLAWYGTDAPLAAPMPPRSATLSLPGGDNVRLMQRLSNPEPTPLTLRFEGSGAVTTVQARFERVGGESVAWSRINARPGTVSIAACGNGRVYALRGDGELASTHGSLASAAWQGHGTLAGATRLACAGTTMYYLGHERQLFELRAPEGTASVGTAGAGAARRIGRPWGAMTIAAAYHGDFPTPWALNDDRTLWFNPEGGVDSRWVNVGRPGLAARIAAAPGRVFALNHDRTLWISPTGRDSSWRLIDHPRAAVDIAATARAAHEPAVLYALNTDGSLWRGTFSH
jgi:hypothetical protein